MAGKVSQENGKKGGRPPGTKNPETLKREEVLRQFRQKAMRAANVLFNSELHVATGQTFLFRIDKEWVPTGTSKKGEPKGYYKRLKPKLVTSPDEIEEYLLNKHTDEGDPDDDQDPGSSFYFMTAKEPNTAGIKDLLDRALGSVAQTFVTEDEKGHRMPITGMTIVKEKPAPKAAKK